MSDAPPEQPPAQPRRAPATLSAFVLLGALLMFGVEPLVGKVLLPAYGGSFYVWTTCLTFFQGALLLGYLYCHLLAPKLGRWHLVLVLLPLPFLPLALSPWPDTGQPVLAIAATLALGVGVPFAVLATTSVVAQSWLVASTPESQPVNPYPLYAASNLGSLLALVAYPFLVEPLVGLRAQRLGWSALFLVYVALAFVVARRLGPLRSPPEESPEEEVPAEGPVPEERAPGGYLTWFSLSAIPSAFLLATTNVQTLDLGAFPFLWVLPLGVYLSTFILSFRERPWCPRWIRRFWLEFAVVGLFVWVNGALGINLLRTTLGALVHTGVLFCLCLVAHDALYRARPRPSRLTSFYLTVALGGWAGGLFVTFVAPLVFSRLGEYPLAIGALALALLVVRFSDFRAWVRGEPKLKLHGSALILLFGLSGIAFAPSDHQFTYRNSYGIYRVSELRSESGGRRVLVSGGTVHGFQIDERPRLATAYYGQASPVVDALGLYAPPRDVAIVGLGIGTLATYFEAGEQVTFFELNPDNEKIARRHFSYLADSPAQPRVVPGDARLTLASQAGARHVLVVDAFSGDAVPAHLLTREALELYLSKVREGGLVVLHVSNRFVDLRPVLEATGSTLGLEAFVREGQPPKQQSYEFPSTWICFSRSEHALEQLRAKGWERISELRLPPTEPWSDDHASLLRPFLAGLGR